MTIIIQFENNNWYAEGVAIMASSLYDHPLMLQTLETIAKENGFDFVSEVERSTAYAHYHALATDGE